MSDERIEVDADKFVQLATKGDVALVAIRLQRTIIAIQRLDSSLRSGNESARREVYETLTEIKDGLREFQQELIGQEGKPA